MKTKILLPSKITTDIEESVDSTIKSKASNGCRDARLVSSWRASVVSKVTASVVEPDDE